MKVFIDNCGIRSHVTAAVHEGMGDDSVTLHVNSEDCTASMLVDLSDDNALALADALRAAVDYRINLQSREAA